MNHSLVWEMLKVRMTLHYLRQVLGNTPPHLMTEVRFWMMSLPV